MCIRADLQPQTTTIPFARMVRWQRSMNVARNLAIALCLITVAILTNCGVAGPPRPPSLNLPQPPSDLRAMRKGDHVFLAWTVPTATTDGVKLRQPGTTEICRSENQVVKSCAQPVATVAAPPPAKAGQGPPAQQTYTDQLPSSMLKNDPAALISYAVSIVNPRGRAAGLSNQVTVPGTFTLAPPSDFRAQVTADGILLSWTGEVQSSDTSGLSHRYRVYRREENSQDEAIAGEMPFGPQRSYLLLDHGFEWEKTYVYRATIVTASHPEGKPETSFEGDDTPPVKVFAHDVFPPAVPAGLQAVFSGAGQQPFIDLTWAPDTEADLAGYNIYRHDAGGAEQKVNSQPVKVPAYRDPTVASGHTYIYSITAVDVRGNESVHSAEATESVP